MRFGDVNIRPFTEDNMLNKVLWINDCESNKFLHYGLPLGEGRARVWFHRNKDRTDRYDTIIEYDRSLMDVIGLLSIINGRAEYYITLGESRYRGEGIARDASILLLRYAFGELDLLEVYPYMEVDNISVQKLSEKCGFVKHHLGKNSTVDRGTLVDGFYYSITASEFCESSKGK